MKAVFFTGIFALSAGICGGYFLTVGENLSEKSGKSTAPPLVRRAPQWVKVYHVPGDAQVFEIGHVKNQDKPKEAWMAEVDKLLSRDSYGRGRDLLVLFSEWLEGDPETAMDEYLKIRRNDLEGRSLLLSHWSTIDPVATAAYFDKHADLKYRARHPGVESPNEIEFSVIETAKGLAGIVPEEGWGWVMALRAESRYAAMRGYFEGLAENQPGLFVKYADQIPPIPRDDYWAEGDNEGYEYMELREYVRKTLSEDGGETGE